MSQSHNDSQSIENDDFDFELLSCFGGGVRTSNLRLEQNELKEQIYNFISNEPRASLNEEFKIMEFWKQKKYDPSYKNLYTLAKIAYGAPFTQAKCERDFSSLLLVYNHLRTKMRPDTLNNILLVKSNLDLLEKVNFF